MTDNFSSTDQPDIEKQTNTAEYYFTCIRDRFLFQITFNCLKPFTYPKDSTEILTITVWKYDDKYPVTRTITAGEFDWNTSYEEDNSKAFLKQKPFRFNLSTIQGISLTDTAYLDIEIFGEYEHLSDEYVSIGYPMLATMF